MTAAQALLYMKDTEGWKVVEKEIRAKIEYHNGRLRDCKSWDEVQQHRGAIEALEAVLVFVDQTIREEVEDGSSGG